jgi:hypothetical protein
VEVVERTMINEQGRAGNLDLAEALQIGSFDFPEARIL